MIAAMSSDAHVSEVRPVRPLAPPRIRRLRVLAGGVLVVLVGAAFHAALPWILPIALLEGPMVQNVTTQGAHLVWFTSRSGVTTVELLDEGAPAPGPVVANGARHEARIDGLRPNSVYRYRIRGDGATLIEKAFQTAAITDQPVKFVVFGDSGRGTTAQYRLAAGITEAQPDFVVHTGDVIYPDGARRRFRERFFRPYREVLARVAFWPSLGNHDVSKETNGEPYREVFSLPENGPEGVTPEANYWFDAGPMRFVVIDTNYRAPAGTTEAELESRVAPWIEQVLADAPAWRVAVFHHPPYTAGSHKPDPVIQRLIVPALERAGVQVVFNGHDHLYIRTHPIRAGEVVAADGGGITYVVTGAGGAKLYDALPPEQRPPYVAALNNEVHSFTKVEADAVYMRMQQIDVDGNVLDDWTIRRSTPSPPAE